MFVLLYENRVDPSGPDGPESTEVPRDLRAFWGPFGALLGPFWRPFGARPKEIWGPSRFWGGEKTSPLKMLRLFDGLGVHGLDAGALCASAPSISAFIAGRIRLLRAVAPSILRLTLNSRTVLTPGACPPRATLEAGLAPWRACAHDETHRSPQSRHHPQAS